MANLRTRPFFTDVPGALPYRYDVPGSVELVVQSVVARFDGAGAAGTFLPCLAVYTQDGHLIARVRPDQEFLVGDTGVVTYAPFLRRKSGFPNGDPRCGMSRNALQSIPNNVLTALSWDTVIENAFGMWSAGTPTRITSAVNGLYVISANIEWAVNGVGHRDVGIRKNGTIIAARQLWMASTSGSATFQATATFQFLLAPGDYFEVVVSQTSGGALDVTGATGTNRMTTH